MIRSTLLLACCAGLFLISPLSGQYFSKDLGSLLTAAQRQEQGQLTAAGLDSLIYRLAYLAAAPDTLAATRLTNGPALLAHFGDNPEILGFLASSGLDERLWAHPGGKKLGFGWLSNTGRTDYLNKAGRTDLFTTNGLIDVEKIQSAYSAPLPPMRMAIPNAVDQAKGQSSPIPQANYISIALSGLSDWIGRRAQEELTYTFLTRLRKQLNEQKLNFLFPNTVAYLPELNLINYKSILPSIRLAFAKDMNQLSLNLGNYLNAREPDVYADPAVYNLFVVYRLLDLGSREVPLSDVLAFTYGELAETRLNTRRSIDLRLADKARQSNTYSTVMTAYNRLVEQLDRVERSFKQAQDNLFDLEEEIADEFGEEPLRPLRNRIDKNLAFDFSDLLFTDQQAPEVVRAWLLGEPAYDYFLANPSLAKYDELFGAAARQLTPAERRAAGLTAVRELLSRGDLLDQRLEELLAARASLDSLNIALRLPPPPSDAAALKQVLRRRLGAELTHFRASGDTIQLEFLGRLLREALPEVSGSMERLEAIGERLDTFTLRRADVNSPNYLRLNPPPPTIEEYQTLSAAISQADLDIDLMRNALAQYSQQEAGSLIRGHRNAANLETIFGLGKELFFLLYNQPEASLRGLPLLEDASDFAEVGTITGFMLDKRGNQLLRGLAVDRLSRIPGLGELNPTGVGNFVLEFAEQLSVLSRPIQAGVLDPRRAARIRTVSFITNTISGIVEAEILSDPNNPGGGRSIADLLPGFAKVPAVNHNLEELFRLSQSGQYRYAVTNLLNLIDLFGIVPEASKREKRLLDRRDYYRQRLVDRAEKLLPTDYRNLALDGPNGGITTNAIDSTAYYQTELQRLNRRLRKLDTARLNRNRQKLFLYGTFMADVAAADSPDAFAAALNNVALPPGSSQLKRNRNFSLEMNAYFGASYGREVLNYPTDITVPGGLPEAESGVAALWVPVGLSMSWKTSFEQRSSYTLFFPLIDLGAVSAYRFETADSQIERLPRFTAQNVFSPGAHFLYNFADTPFSLGIGAQYGPTTRRIDPLNGPVFNAAGVRYMLTFSVDVPIFSFGGSQ